MSAQCYTNKRRILAEASVRKVQYPGSVGLNNKAIYASIGCNQDFKELVYLINLCCKKIPNNAPPEPELFVTLDGGSSNTDILVIVDGGNAITRSYEIIDGGNS